MFLMFSLTAHRCKLTRTKKIHFVGLLIMILHCTIRDLLIEKQGLIFTNTNKFTGIDMYGRITIEHQLNLTRTLIYQCIRRENNILHLDGMETNSNVKVKLQE